MYGAVTVVVVAAGLIIALLWAYAGGGFNLGGSGAPSPEVRVSQLTLDFSPSNNSCFTSEYQTTHSQTVVAGQPLVYNVSLQDGNPAAARNCTVTGLVVGTAGFSLVSSDAPLLVGTGSGALTFTLATPTTAFNGSVLITAIVTYHAPDIQVSAQNFAVTGGGGQCGTVSASSPGFSSFGGGTYTDSVLVISLFQMVTCSVSQVTLDGSPGFAISATNLPVQLPIDSFASVSVSLSLPSTPYQGELNFTLTLSPS